MVICAVAEEKSKVRRANNTPPRQLVCISPVQESEERYMKFLTLDLGAN